MTWIQLFIEMFKILDGCNFPVTFKRPFNVKTKAFI